MVGLIAGVELDMESGGCTDGTWKGIRLFKCPDGRAYFCPLRCLQYDTTYMFMFTDKEQVESPFKKSIENPLKNKTVLFDENDGLIKPDQFSKYIGNERGIQGHQNSCYVDATVFGLFALSDIFDDVFLQESDDEAGRRIGEILQKGIINPLRNCGLALHESVMRLRDSLEELGEMKGANRDEKDPEEFLNLLFKEILHVEPFLSIKRPFGIEKEFFIQLFLQVDPNDPCIPKTEELLGQFFHESNISFEKPPSKLLLQMPRFGKDFKMFNKIIPSLTLNVIPLLDQKDETINMNVKDNSVLSTMKLLSVICIETSHYVCFSRDKNNKWLFHDSMADRLSNTYSIPRVVDVTECLNEWVYSPENHERLRKALPKDIPEYVRRFTQDIYMCVYVNEYLALNSSEKDVLSPGITPSPAPQPGCYNEVPPKKYEQEKLAEEGEDEENTSFDHLKALLIKQQQNISDQLVAIESLKMNNDATRRKNENEIIRLTKEKEDLEIEKEKLAREFADEGEILENEKAILKGEKSTLEKTLQELQVNNQQLQEEKQQLQEEKQQLQEENQQLQDEKQQLLGGKQQLQEENQQLQDEKQQLLGGKQQLQEENQQLQEENQQLLGGKQQLQEENQQLQEENQQLLGGKQQLQEENQQFREENQQFREENQQFREENQQLQEENQQLQGERQELQENVKVLTNSWKISHKDVKITREELGRGGWGVIWIGQFRGQKVAVKQLHELIVTQDFLQLLHREINTMSQLRHPNLLQFIGAVLDDPSGNPMIVTEIMDVSLRGAYERKQLSTLPVHIPLAIMRDVAVGLNYLHCLPDPIIHRDVSSANVLLESKGPGKWKTKISDFGSAKIARLAVTKAAGSLVYSAPESVNIILDEEDHPLTPKMDVFSYGVLLCEVLTCQFPDQQVFREMLGQVRSQHHPYLHDLLHSCIKRNPQDRPNMDQVIQQLDEK